MSGVTVCDDAILAGGIRYRARSSSREGDHSAYARLQEFALYFLSDGVSARQPLEEAGLIPPDESVEVIENVQVAKPHTNAASQGPRLLRH